MIAGEQVPAPSQVRVATNVLPEHSAGAQAWFEPCFRHAPAPSHRPSLPQVSGAVAGQVSCGSIPPMTLAQVPFGLPVYDSAQAMQVPEHAVAQQTPSTQ